MSKSIIVSRSAQIAAFSAEHSGAIEARAEKRIADTTSADLDKEADKIVNRYRKTVRDRAAVALFGERAALEIQARTAYRKRVTALAEAMADKRFAALLVEMASDTPIGGTIATDAPSE